MRTTYSHDLARPRRTLQETRACSRQVSKKIKKIKQIQKTERKAFWTLAVTSVPYYMFLPNGSRNPKISNAKCTIEPVRLLIILNGTRHLSVHDAHAPATRLRRPARVHELTIAAGIDSSSTFVRQDGEVAPTDAKRVLKCHPESIRLRRSPAAKRLATGSARSPAWRPSCRVSSRASPRPTTAPSAMS
jgi:hypothetical protein